MIRWLPALALAVVAFGQSSPEQARDIVRKSVELDQENWRRAPDYTWTVNRTERRLESDGKVKSEKRESWETFILYGEPHRKFSERDSKPLSAEELRKQ